MTKQTTLKLVHSADALSSRVSAATRGQSVDLLRWVLSEGVLQGDAEQLLDHLRCESVDLFFTSSLYADARAYSCIHPDRYVEWFLPLARSMYYAAKALRQSDYQYQE